MSACLRHKRDIGYITGLFISAVLLLSGMLHREVGAAAPGTVFTLEWSQPGDFYIKLTSEKYARATKQHHGTLYICTLKKGSQYELPQCFGISDAACLKFSATSTTGLVQICFHDVYSVALSSSYNSALPEGKLICSAKNEPLRESIKYSYFPLDHSMTTGMQILKPEKDSPKLDTYKKLREHHDQRLQNRLNESLQVTPFDYNCGSSGGTISKKKDCKYINIFSNAHEPVPPASTCTAFQQTAQTDDKYISVDMETLDTHIIPLIETLKAKLKDHLPQDYDQELQELLKYAITTGTVRLDPLTPALKSDATMIARTGKINVTGSPDEVAVEIRVYSPDEPHIAEAYATSCNTLAQIQNEGKKHPFPWLITYWESLGLHIQILPLRLPATHWKSFPARPHSFKECLHMTAILLDALDQLHQQHIGFNNVSPAIINPAFSQRGFTDPVFRTIAPDIVRIEDGQDVSTVVRADIDTVLQTLFYLRTGKTLKDYWHPVDLISDALNAEQEALTLLYANPKNQWATWMTECQQTATDEECSLVTRFSEACMNWSAAADLRKQVAMLEKDHLHPSRITTKQSAESPDHTGLSQIHLSTSTPSRSDHFLPGHVTTTPSFSLNPNSIETAIPQAVTTFTSPYRLTCSHSHNMCFLMFRQINIIKKMHPNKIFCASCNTIDNKKTELTDGHVMYCQQCRYSLCAECTLSRLGLATLPLAVRCSRNHRAHLTGGSTIKRYGYASYNCDGEQCKVSDKVQTLHYRCDECYAIPGSDGYDLCLTCGIQAPAALPQCNKGHTMSEVNTANTCYCCAPKCRNVCHVGRLRFKCMECISTDRKYNLCLSCGESKVKTFETKRGSKIH